MGNQITLAYNHSSGKEPDTLTGGEVAINTFNRKIWVGNGSSNTLVFNSSDYLTTSQLSSTYATNASTVDISTNNTGLNLVRRNATGTIYVTNVSATGNAGFNSLSVSTGENISLHFLWGRQTSNSYLRCYSASTVRTWLGVGDGKLTEKNFTSSLLTKLNGIDTSADVNRTISDSVTSTNSTISASAAAVKLAYDLAASKSDAPNNAQANVGIQFNGSTAGSGIIVAGGFVSHVVGTPWNHIPHSGVAGQLLGYSAPGKAQWVSLNTTTSSTSTTTAASASSVKAAYDRTWSTAPNDAEANVGVLFNGVLSSSTGGLQMGGGYVSHYIGTPWNHIPANGSSGQFLGWDSSGTAKWVAAPVYNLPTATDTVLGGVKAGGYTSSGTNYCVKIDGDRQLYVTVPSSGGTTTWNGMENISNLTALP